MIAAPESVLAPPAASLPPRRFTLSGTLLPAPDSGSHRGWIYLLGAAAMSSALVFAVVVAAGALWWGLGRKTPDPDPPGGSLSEPVPASVDPPDVTDAASPEVDDPVLPVESPTAPAAASGPARAAEPAVPPAKKTSLNPTASVDADALRGPSGADVPVAASEAAAPSAAPTSATIEVIGDAGRVWLESTAGRFKAGQVPPGTYKVTAFFDGTNPVVTGEITVKAGDHRQLRCSSELLICR